MADFKKMAPIQREAEICVPRRQVLGTMGMTGFGLLAGSVMSSAGSVPVGNMPASSEYRTSVELQGLLDVPEEWAANNRDAVLYYRYLKALRLRHVDARQVVETHARERGRVWNTLPPRAWWKRMGYVLKVVDRIAREMNVSEVEVVSAYRSSAYNARCRGAKAGSWHKQNVAVDVKFPIRPSKVTAVARELRNLGLFRGGVGGYWNFTHIDARGKNVDW